MNTTPIKKAAGGFKTTTATALYNATDFIANSASKTSAGQVFHAYFCQHTDRLQYRSVGPRDTVRISLNCGAGARNTVIDSGVYTATPSAVFSRPEFEDVSSFGRIYGFGRDGLVREAGRMAESMLRTSRPPVACRKAASGFQSHSGAEPMTHVNRTTTPKTGNTSPLIRQQAIENALSMALFHVRKGDTHRAVAKSIRAASMLKQACAEIQNGGAA